MAATRPDAGLLRPAAPAPSAAASAAPVEAAPVETAPVEAALVEARPIGGVAGNCTPAYPASALRQGQHGAVTLRVTVSPLGRATTARVEHSSGAPLLDEAALSKVLHDCRYLPASRNGAPIEGIALQTMRFDIQE